MLAAQRARDVSAGSALTIDRDNDKNPVVALREIADDKLDLDAIQQSIVKNLSVHEEPEEPEDEGGFGTGETDMLADDCMKNEAAAGVQKPRGRRIRRTILRLWRKNPLTPRRRKAERLIVESPRKRQGWWNGAGRLVWRDRQSSGRYGHG